MNGSRGKTPERAQSVSSIESAFRTPAESPTRKFAEIDPVPVEVRRQRPADLLSSWTADTPSGQPQLQVNGAAANEPELENTPPRPSSTGQGSVSSTNNDHGLTHQFHQTLREGGVSDDGAELVVGVGSNFRPVDGPQPQEVDVSESKSSQPDQSDPFTGLVPLKSDSLGFLLRKAFKASTHKDGSKFLPVDAWKRILTKAAVRAELTNEGFKPSVVQSYSNKIWEASWFYHDGHGEPKSRRRIFTILVLIGQVTKIGYFIEEAIWDSDLPFTQATLEELEEKTQRYLYRKDSKQPIKCFENEGKGAFQLAEAFVTNQWCLLAPTFQLADGIDSSKKVIHYNLEDRTVLPFVAEKETDGQTQTGGFGRVWRVKIHPAHYNCNEPEDHDKNPWFAVKLLYSKERHDFNQEVKSLKRLIHTNNDHLIKLLLTYRYRGDWHLLFPWADENLLTFWRNHTSRPKTCYLRARWVARQCDGLVRGVSDIHQPESKAENRTFLSASQHDKNWGRHGDLKPENILWFRQGNIDSGDDDGMGIVKITDFGLTRFHGDASREKHHPEGFPTSPTYRTPEYEIKKMLSPEYDIWSLGCVLLNFVIWYYRGWEGVDKFSIDRAQDDSAEIKSDQYFQLVKVEEPPPDDIVARLKPSVERCINELRDDPDCSQFFRELLDYIHRHMLRIRPIKRHKAQVIKKDLALMLTKCERDQAYCSDPQPKPIHKRRTNSSSLEPVAAPVELSAKTKDQVRESNAPKHRGKLETAMDGLPDLLEVSQSSDAPGALFADPDDADQEVQSQEQEDSLAVGTGPIQRRTSDNRPASMLSDLSSHGFANAHPPVIGGQEATRVEPRSKPSDTAAQPLPTPSSRPNNAKQSGPGVQRPKSPTIPEEEEYETKTEVGRKAMQWAEEGERRGSGSSISNILLGAGMFQPLTPQESNLSRGESPGASSAAVDDAETITERLSVDAKGRALEADTRNEEGASNASPLGSAQSTDDSADEPREDMGSAQNTTTHQKQAENDGQDTIQVPPPPSLLSKPSQQEETEKPSQSELETTEKAGAARNSEGEGQDQRRLKARIRRFCRDAKERVKKQFCSCFKSI